jgi:hypothetical protein
MRRARNLCGSRACVRRFGHAVTGVLKRQAKHATQAIFIFDKQNVRHKAVFSFQFSVFSFLLIADCSLLQA